MRFLSSYAQGLYRVTPKPMHHLGRMGSPSRCRRNAFAIQAAGVAGQRSRRPPPPGGRGPRPGSGWSRARPRPRGQPEACRYDRPRLRRWPAGRTERRAVTSSTSRANGVISRRSRRSSNRVSNSLEVLVELPAHVVGRADRGQHPRRQRRCEAMRSSASRSSPSNATQASPRGVTATNSSPIGESDRRLGPRRRGRLLGRASRSRRHAASADACARAGSAIPVCAGRCVIASAPEVSSGPRSTFARAASFEQPSASAISS